MPRSLAASLAALCLALAGCGGAPKKTDEDKPTPVPLEPAIAEAPPALTGVRDAAQAILIVWLAVYVAF